MGLTPSLTDIGKLMASYMGFNSSLTGIDKFLARDIGSKSRLTDKIRRVSAQELKARCHRLEESFITLKNDQIVSVLQQIVKTFFLLVSANSIKDTRLSFVCPASVHNTLSNILSSGMWLSKNF